MHTNLLLVVSVLFAYTTFAQQNVGIGTNTPLSRLHVSGGNLLITGAYNTSEPFVGIQNHNAESRLMWIPSRGAFRVGYTPAPGVDFIGANLGNRSMGWGTSVLASGELSTAFGFETRATNVGTTAWGNRAYAEAQYATAWGTNTLATGNFATAWGEQNQATQRAATAWGNLTRATEEYATAWGKSSLASALHSTAWGQGTTASATNSTAWGLNTTAQNVGATALGTGTLASGAYSFAAGTATRARGNFSIAMGDGSQAFGLGSMAIGENVRAGAKNEIVLGAGFIPNIPETNDNTDEPNERLFTLSSRFNNMFSQYSNIPIRVLKNGAVGINNELPTRNLDISGSVRINNSDNLNTALEIAHMSNFKYSLGYDPNQDRFFIYDGISNTNALFIKSGRVGVSRSPTTNAFEVNGNASKTSSGSWLANSDARLKQHIRVIQNPLDLINKLKGITFEWNDDKTGMERPKGVQIGFTAQNIQEVFPENVQLDGQGYLQTAYGNYDALFVEAIKDLKKEIEMLKAEIKLLKEGK